MNTSSFTINTYGEPIFIKAQEIGETIEFIYKQILTSSYTIYTSSPEEKVFKIVFSCKNGKWNKSEPIYGTIIPAAEEDYYFEN